ncbi:SI1L3 protein, partial [Asarcornis scutulata]|nr:SI1L3 protein [Asarcornis scutulata]
MGVRARIADWPPKREPAAASPSREGGREAAAAPRGGPGGQQPPLGGGGGGGGGVSGLKALHRLARRRSKDVEFQEGWPRSCGRPLVPLRHRSSSEVTLSECDPEEAAEAR